MKTFRPLVVFLTVLLFSHAGLSFALPLKAWGNGEFFGSPRSEMHKRFGPPDNPGELDAYLINDSPDFMMIGMLGYEQEKVTSVYVVCRPSLTFSRIKEIQMKDPAVEFVSETKQGALFRFKSPQPGGPRFMSVTHPDDSSTGPMVCAAITNPFEGPETGGSQGIAKTKSTGSDVWSVLQGKWTNEHGGEMTITDRTIDYTNPLLEAPKDINAPESNKVIALISVKGTIDLTGKDEFDTIWFKVRGHMLIGDAKGNPKQEVGAYQDDQFFWIRFPDPNQEYSLVMSSEIGMNAIEPGLSKK